MWICSHLGQHYGANVMELRLVHRQRIVARTNNVNNSRSTKDVGPIILIETTEYIAREKWLIDYLHSIRPTPPSLEAGEKRL